MYNHRIISFLTFTSIFWLTELIWASFTWAIVSAYLFPSPVSKGRPGSRNTEEDDGDDSEGRITPTSDIKSSTIHPLAPAEDDSEDIPRPYGVYASPEATPGPEGEEGDADEEDSEDYAGGRNGIGA